MNDIFKLRRNEKIFADDTAVIYTSNSWDSLKQQVENDLKNIMEWFHDRLLSINTTKILYIPFTSYAKFNPLPIVLNKGQLSSQAVDKIKYLCIY